MVRSRDTSDDAWSVQRDILRRMSGSERVEMAFQMSEAARAVAEAGIRHRHREWTDEQVRDELITRMLGVRLASRVRQTRAVRV